MLLNPAQSPYVVGGPLGMTSEEKLPIAFDFGPVLSEGETITAAGDSRLLSYNTNEEFDYGLFGNPAVFGSQVQQVVTGLVAGQIYKLHLKAVTSFGKEWAGILVITCTD